MKSLLKVNNLRISFCRDDKWQEAVHGVDFEVFKDITKKFPNNKIEFINDEK